MAGIIIWHIEKDVVVKSHYIISKSCSHWNTLEKWTLPYKIHKVGHCDLIEELVRAIHPRCLQTTYALCKSYRLDLCHQSVWKDRRTEGRTDGWTPDNGWLHKLSLSLQLISWAKNILKIFFGWRWWQQPRRKYPHFCRRCPSKKLKHFFSCGGGNAPTSARHPLKKFEKIFFSPAAAAVEVGAHFEVPTHYIWIQYLNPIPSYGPK